MRHWIIVAGALLAGAGHFIVAVGAAGAGATYLRLSGALMLVLAVVALLGRGHAWMRAGAAVLLMVAATSVWRLAAFPWPEGAAAVAFLLHHVGIFVLGGAVGLAVAWPRPAAAWASRAGAALAGMGALWSAFGAAATTAWGAGIEGVGFLALALVPFGVRDAPDA